MQTILLVDDDATQRLTINMLIAKTFGHKSMEAENGRECLSILQADREKKIKLVILDLNMPEMDGFEVLEHMAVHYPDVPVIILTGSKKTTDVDKAIKLGAKDFLSKPIQPERFKVSVQNTLKMTSLNKEISRLQKLETSSFKFTDLIGHESGLKIVIDMAQKAANTMIPILISGETGVGKEVFAKAIHGESDRAGNQFIAINCGAIPEKLVESTLFGHEKGSFTGAITKSIGKFREAQSGTIFLDEIGELPPNAQVKLLRVLQQKEVEPVGAGQPVSVDVRIISATNRNLEEEVQKGRFREDLYFRLNVLQLSLPPLRHRQADILNLARHFINRFSATENLSLKDISKEAQNLLINYDWPGNVRELENTIHRALVLSDEAHLTQDDFIFAQSSAVQDTIDAQDQISLRKETGEFKTLEEIEADAIKKMIHLHDGNMTQASKTLGVAKSTLYRKV